MKRLKGFDYTKPYFYMVTLKKLKGLSPFCQITNEKAPKKDVQGRVRYLVANELTEAFAREIRGFYEKWWGLHPVDCFIIMPDHIHLLVHIKNTGDQLALGKYVYQLMKALSLAYWRVVGMADGTAIGNTRMTNARRADPRVALPAPSGEGGWLDDPSVVLPAPSGNLPPPAKLPPVFARDWHEWIVKKDGQLAAFTRYIRENPARAWLRQQNRQYFGRVSKVAFLGREWFAYGNLAILELPVMVAVKGHRATKPDSPEWNTMVEACARIGPGGAGIGTFMSPLEKACGNAIAAAGGKWVVLSPEGFHERWHPGRQYEKYCADGRMLFLSLYPAMERKPTKQELYRRCHEMGDIAVAGCARPRKIFSNTPLTDEHKK